MSRKTLGMISGKVRVADQGNLDPNRYDFLSLENAEPNLGAPSSNNGLLSSETDGSRTWLIPNQGLAVSNSNDLFVDETGVPIDTSSYNNSSSNVLSDVLIDLDQGITNAVAGTLDSVATDSTIDGDGTTDNPLSVVTSGDAETLDGEQPSYYLNYNNFTNTPTIGDGTITVSGGSGLSGSTSFSTNQSSNQTITLDNTDKGSDQNIFKNVAVSGQDTLVADSNNDTLNIVGDSSISVTTDTSTDTLTIEFNGSDSGDYVDSVSFNDTTGDLTLTRTGTLSDLTASLDGRYLLEGAKAADADLLDGENSTYYLNYNNFTNTPTLYTSSDFDVDFSNKSTSDLSEGSNLYYTDTRVDSHLSGGTGVSYSSGTISIGQAVGTSDNVEFNDVIVAGDLTVSGTTTTVNTETLDIADNNITLNSNYSGSSPTENGGITVNRGTQSDVVLQWNESSDHWEIESGGVTGRILTTGDEGSGNGLDADLLDGQDGTYYLNYSNFTNTPETAVTSDTAPSSPDDGDLWWDTSLGQLFVYYDDGTNAQWVEASPAAGSVEETTPNDTLITLDAGNGLSGGGDFTTNQETEETITFSIGTDAIGTDELNVSGTGTSGQALLSNGDGSFSFGAAGADITDDTTTNSDFYLTLSDSTSGSFTTATISSSRLYFNPSTGTLNSTEYNSLSDKSLKKNIDTINNGIDVINQIRPVSFEWKDTDKSSFGVIAQEIEEILPEIVETNDEGTKSVAYNKIIAFLIDAVKTLDERTRN